jgi:hypothetical protein
MSCLPSAAEEAAVKQPDPKRSTADQIVQYARDAANGIEPIRGGILQAFVRMLIEDRDRSTAERTPTADDGCEIANVYVDGEELTVMYEYDPGDPGNLDGPPDSWVQPTPDTLELCGLWAGDRWLNVGLLNEQAAEKISDQILAHEQKKADAEAQAAWEDLQERRLEEGYP